MLPRILLAALPLATVLAAALPAPAEAQSFNCRYARYADEILICQRPDLGALDERLSTVFYRVRNELSASERVGLDEEQAIWLEGRHACGRDAACIEDSYIDRIRELRRY